MCREQQRFQEAAAATAAAYVAAAAAGASPAVAEGGQTPVATATPGSVPAATPKAGRKPGDVPKLDLKKLAPLPPLKILDPIRDMGLSLVSQEASARAAAAMPPADKPPVYFRPAAPLFAGLPEPRAGPAVAALGYRSDQPSEPPAKRPRPDEEAEPRDAGQAPGPFAEDEFVDGGRSTEWAADRREAEWRMKWLEQRIRELEDQERRRVRCSRHLCLGGSLGEGDIGPTGSPTGRRSC